MPNPPGVDSPPEGMYDAVVTRSLLEQLTAAHLAKTIERLDDADQPSVLARHVAQAVERALDRKSEDLRVALVNRVLSAAQAEGEELPGVAERLVSYLSIPGPGTPRKYSGRPVTPLAETALLTNARDEPSLGSEIRGEMGSADRVDLLLAFVKWTGLRVLEAELRGLRERGVALRVLTTTYIGATERRALDRLVTEFGAEVKVNYETKRTRLHAKAWIFHRETGFDTAFIGSSNLSTAALLEGLEWNVRISRHATPELMRKAEATFETYWNDRAFEPYDPGRDGMRLDRALLLAAGRSGPTVSTLSLSGLEVRPYPFQEEMLEALEVEREVHGRHRNLVVAATGTGKTVVAALDYLSLCRAWGGPARPTLLFVAHRREILEQSLRTYREVLGDGNFGELFVGGARPTRWQHVFASIQSLNAGFMERLAADAFEIVVVDEFHHAEASSYRRLLAKIAPKELLGLTATPERGDGLDVRAMFDNRTAVELRLWDAMEAELLSPFHYFGIADNTDLRRIAWKRGTGYDTSQLSRLYTANDARLRIVLTELQDKVSDIASMRALGFCVSVEHANWMAAKFAAHGIAALSVTGQTSEEDRRAALHHLANGTVKILFTVDLFNEGVDLPDVDTILFLRPTESATVFLQQLGRGLRRTRDKAVLTALDFVGHQNREFRFDQRFRALTGGSRSALKRQVEHGFSFLPSGSQIILDKQTQARVLENLSSQVTSRWAGIVSELRSLGDVSLQVYLDETGVELPSVVCNGRSWTRARREAGLPTASGGPREADLLRRCAAFAHVDDPERAEAYLRLLADGAPGYRHLDEAGQHWVRMLLFSFFPGKNQISSFDAAFDILRAEPSIRAEVSEIIGLAVDRARHRTSFVPGTLARTRLRTHARYSREEIVAALGYATLDRPPSSMMQGVFRAKAVDTDVFLVTLKKSEADYSPTTMYRDYAISPELFHWESQSQTTVASPTGRRYVRQRELKGEVLIFVREQKVWEFGKGAPYTLLGPADYVSHRNERPIEIVWKLRTPMPADLFQAARAAVG